MQETPSATLRGQAGTGIRLVTVARALGIPAVDIANWERGHCLPSSPAGFRWARVTRALERRALVTAEIAAMRDEAA